MKKHFLFACFILYILLILCALWRGAYLGAFTNTLTLVLLAVVYMLVKDKERYVPVLSAATILFIVPIILGYAGMPLENTTAGIDKIFHACAGAILAWFMLVHLKTKGAMLYGLAFCFAVTMGAWWEVYEWLFHMHGTNFALVYTDTVLDLVADSLGALAALLIHWFKKEK